MDGTVFNLPLSSIKVTSATEGLDVLTDLHSLDKYLQGFFTPKFKVLASDVDVVATTTDYLELNYTGIDVSAVRGAFIYIATSGELLEVFKLNVNVRLFGRPIYYSKLNTTDNIFHLKPIEVSGATVSAVFVESCSKLDASSTYNPFIVGDSMDLSLVLANSGTADCNVSVYILGSYEPITENIGIYSVQMAS